VATLICLFRLYEPEAALSPQRQLAALVRMHQLVESGSQLIIATHSPILMAYPQATIFEVSDAGLRRIDYRGTEHYRVTKDFLDNPDGMIRALFSGK
jgi:predicted ATPase